MKTYHSARYPFLWAQTTEEDRLIREQRAVFPESVGFFSWDISAGFRALTKNGSGWIWSNLNDEVVDPGQALLYGASELPENSVLFLKDFHKYFQDITIIRKALNVKDILKASARLFVFVSAVGGESIPVELSNDITLFPFSMPSRAQLESAVLRIAEDNGLEAPNGDLGAIVDSLTGLTLEAAENALCKVLVESKRFDYKGLLQEKISLLKSTAGLTFSQYQESFQDLYGWDMAKEFCLRTAVSPMSKGVLLYGVPGCGKSHFGKALANALKRPCLCADFGALRGELQGQAETRSRVLFQTAGAFGPHVLFSDEFDKAVSGSGASSTDGGTGQRILQKILIEGEDRAPGSYWVFTANSLDEVLSLSGGALVRRFDAIFFVDLPSQDEAQGIAGIWAKKMSVSIPESFDFDGYSGADIKKLCQLMAMMGTTAQDAKRFIIPTKQALGPRLDEIRRKARSVCLPVSSPVVQGQVIRKVSM